MNMKTRPASITVIAIVNIILAALGFCGLIGTIIMRLKLVPIPTEGNTTLEITMNIMENNTAYRLFTDISTILGTLASIAVLVAAIGMFLLKNWARMITIGWNIYSIIILIAGSVLNYFLIITPILEQIQEPEKSQFLFGQIFGHAFIVLYLGYYIFSTIWLNRPAIIQAFNQPNDSEKDWA